MGSTWRNIRSERTRGGDLRRAARAAVRDRNRDWIPACELMIWAPDRGPGSPLRFEGQEGGRVSG